MRRAEMWEKIDAETQRRIDDLVIESKAELRAAGFPAVGSRFPYGLHHEFYRVRVRIGRRKMLHAETAAVLNRWMASRSDKADYARQAICGAVKGMLARSPELAGRIPPAVRHAMSAVGDGYDFLAWAKKFAADHPDGFLPDDQEESRDEMVGGLIDAYA